MNKDIFNVLIVDDSKTIIRYLLELLTQHEHNLFYCFNKVDAGKIIESNDIDILITDIFVPQKEDGLEIISNFRKRNPFSRIFAISGYFTIDLVIQCFRSGADDVLPKTFTHDQFYERFNLLKAELNNRMQEYGNKKLSTGATPSDIFIGKSNQIKTVLEKVQKIIRYDPDTILIEGESGVGKDLLATIINQISIRKGKNFVALNCAAFPETLIDSEIFGYEKGSFTGASRMTPGKFELANQGILFLDEIGEMPINFQAKFLRVLESQRFYRIGGREEVQVDAMVIAASNKSLIDLVKEKKFREDLFFRLGKFRIHIPPLREHKEDIPLLIVHFIDIMNRKFKADFKISSEAVGRLIRYNYPGNVRELRNVLENAAMFCKDEVISEQDVRFYFDSKETYWEEAISNDLILELLKENKGNISRTAEIIGFSREGLSKKLKRLNIDKDEYKN